MKPEQKKYIDQWVGKKSVKAIASALGIRERNVQKYIDSRASKEEVRAENAFVPAPVPPVAWWVRALLIAAVVILTAFAYSNAFSRDYIWDDEFLIRDNLYIKNFSHIGTIFRTYLASSSGNINTFYRPIQELTYMIDNFLWGSDLIGFHLTNNLLHVACAVLVYLLVFRILKRTIPAFTAAALFGVHPINTEAVTYAAGRADPLFLLFFLLAFIAFLRAIEPLGTGGRVKGPFYVASLVAYALSILSKEIGMILPLFFVLYAVAFYPKGALRRRILLFAVSFTVVIVLDILWRHLFVFFSPLAPASLMGKFGLFARLLTTCKAICIYLGLLVAPFGLHMERVVQVARSLAEPTAFLAAGIVTILIGLTVFAYRRSSAIFFAAAWFFVGLLPVSNIVPINSFIAEHWLYLPAIGVFMAVGVAIDRLVSLGALTRWSRLAMLAGALAIFFLCDFYLFLTIARNRDWRDEVAFFRNTIAHHPKNARLHLNFGNTYYEKGMLDEALAEYRRCLAIIPSYPEAHANVASIAIQRRQYAQAKEELAQALSAKPNFPNALFMLGNLEEREGNAAAAQERYLKALEVQPDFIECHLQLARSYVRAGAVDKAVVHWRKVLAIQPQNREANELMRRYAP